MPRITGDCRISSLGGERVQAFIPFALPPEPALEFDESMKDLLSEAHSGLRELEVWAGVLPNRDWFLYGFVRKEAVITSQIEGTQATLQDVISFEAIDMTSNPEDVAEVCNYVNAITFARNQMSRPDGLPISSRLLCEAHLHLMSGARGSTRQPGEIRRTQNWIGGSRPGDAAFVPPPPEAVREALTSLELWIHAPSDIPPLIRAGLAHVQFETIHPFLDGNGRIGRLLIALLLEHWKLLSSPILYLSLSFKRRQSEYYSRLSNVRLKGDWEGWTRFFLECVTESTRDAVRSIRAISGVLNEDRAAILKRGQVTVSAIRLLDVLPAHPMVNLERVTNLLSVSKPTAADAIKTLINADILCETTGKRRDRVYSYHRYLELLTRDTQFPS